MENCIYFWDSKTIRIRENVQVFTGEVEKYEGNPFFGEGYFEDPPIKWEVRYDNGYPNIFYDESIGRYRLYYTLFIRDEESEKYSLEERVGLQYRPKRGRITALAYAESEDGINFVRPNLGLVEFDGSTNNNLIRIKAHGTCVFMDEHDIDPQRRYKLMMRDDHNPYKIAIATSADGINFTEPVPLLGINDRLEGDTHNFVIYDPDRQKYFMTTRIFSREQRVIAMLSSSDFVNWSYGEEVFRGLSLEDQFYSMPVFKLNRLYIGLISVFHGGDISNEDFDCVDLELAYSEDMRHWSRVSPFNQFIPRSNGVYKDGKWDSGCIYSAVPIRTGDEYRFYYMGGNGQHTNYRETSLGYATVPVDRLAGIKGKRSEESYIRLNRIAADAGEVYLNAQVEDGGYIYARFIKPDGTVIEGFDYDDFKYTGASGNRVLLEWTGGNIPGLYDEYVLEFRFMGAKLYALYGDFELVTYHK